VSALRRVLADAERRGAAEHVRLEAGDLEGEFAGESTAALVAAVREALNNVRKHANATEVVVRCERAGDGARVVVSDDGVGTDLAELGTGIGLRHSIMGRMARFGGRADFQSAPGAGMQVTMTTDVLGVAA
jgi:signal transduction histidine kinase